MVLQFPRNTSQAHLAGKSKYPLRKRNPWTNLIPRNTESGKGIISVPNGRNIFNAVYFLEKGIGALKPNIVFVLTDDQGYGDLGCTGNPWVKTPSIDAFYDQSLRLTDFHVGPTCAPTRAGLMTGHYCNSTGVWHTVGGRSLMREEEWTLAEALGGAGYATGLFGKWHLGDNHPYLPHERGFQTAIYHGGGGISQTPDWWGNDYFNDTYHVNGVPKPFEGYCTDVFFREALKFIEENKDRPFFCYLSANAPHGPYNVEDRYANPYREQGVPEARARFYGMISNIDENFAKLRAKLQDLGIEDRTILIFMTDNGSSCGAMLDPDGFVVEGFNAGLRGMKGSAHEGGHRVPFFIRCPALGIDGGREVDALTANVDFMPTLLELCEVPVAKEHRFHGRSLCPLLQGKDMPELDDRIVVTDSQRMARPIKWRRSAAMRGKWRLISGRELFDIETDPGQHRDVAAEHPQIVEELRAGYEAWWELCKSQYRLETPLHIGSEDAVEVCLCSHDWRVDDLCDSSAHPWSQRHIREGLASNGRWEVIVCRSGRYRFELRRWPREAGHALGAGIEGDDIEWRRDAVQPGYENLYSGGVSLPLREAFIEIGGMEDSKPIDPQNPSVDFEINLDAGPTQLYTWFWDGHPQIDTSLRGAYYVYASFLGD